MLVPFKNSTSVTSTTYQKIATHDKHNPCLIPDFFFKPISAENGLSCTYSPEFYEAFSQRSHSQFSQVAMLVLEYMTVHDKARLPLFKGASESYVKLVLPAIQEIITNNDEDEDTQTTKTQIINCASQIGYLTRSSDVFQGTVILSRISLIRMNLSDAYLPRACLRGSDLRGVDLSRADLSFADLSFADLRGAKLQDATLLGANFSGADLEGAYSG